MSDQTIRGGRGTVLEALRQMTPEEQIGLVRELLAESDKTLAQKVAQAADEFALWECYVCRMGAKPLHICAACLMEGA